MRTLIMLILAALLSACNVFSGPGLDVVRQAIAQQVEMSQQMLSPQFYATPRTIPFKIQRIRVSGTELVPINNRSAFHITGQYDIQFRSPGLQTTQTDNTFDVYVFECTDDASWWLARPNSASKTQEWTFSLLSHSGKGA